MTAFSNPLLNDSLSPVLAFSVLLLLSGAVAEPYGASPKFVPPEITAERIRACGFEQTQVKYERVYDEDVVEVSGVSTMPESKMLCVAQVSLDTQTLVQFPKPLDDAYWRFYFRLEKERDQREARAWLQRRGLLAKLPAYEKGRTDGRAFVRNLESFCGAKAKGRLTFFHGKLAFKAPSPSEVHSIDEQTFECLLAVANATGLEFGFIGNEHLLVK